MDSQPASKLDRAPASETQILNENFRLNQLPPDVWWAGLTTLPQKWEEYSRESFFRESLYDLENFLGSDKVIASLQSIAMIGIKPEAMAGRRGERILEFLFENGYSAIDFRRIRYNPLASREVWRFQWNVATLDRLFLWDYIADQGPALLVTLHDRTADPDVPASVRLRGLKGSAIPQLRESGTLRGACMAPNRILTMVHAADEPVDIMREIGILMSARERADWASRIRMCAREAVDGACLAELNELYEGFPVADFDIDAARNRVRDSIMALRRDAKADSQIRALTALLDETADKDLPFRLRDWWRNSHDASLNLAPWDLITIASHAIQHDVLDAVCTIDDDGRPEWVAGLGAMVWNGE